MVSLILIYDRKPLFSEADGWYSRELSYSQMPCYSGRHKTLLPTTAAEETTLPVTAPGTRRLVHGSQLAARYSDFYGLKRLWGLLFPLDGMLVHHRLHLNTLPGCPKQFAGAHLYSWVNEMVVPRRMPLASNYPASYVHLGTEVLYESLLHCPRTQRSASTIGLTPGPFQLKSSALTLRSPHLPYQFTSYIWTSVSSPSV